MSAYDKDFWLRETFSMLALSSIKGVGYWTLYRLSLAGLTFNQVLKASSFEEFADYLSRAEGKIPRPKQEWTEFQKELWDKGKQLHRRLTEQEIKVIHAGEESFPSSLRKIPDPPNWLFIQGNITALHQFGIAIVGTREPSEDGEFLAKYVGSFIPYFNSDTVTISGLATGIDQIIHKQSIRFQVPTIAVLGTGIFSNYPSESENLRDNICVNGGAVITEYLPNQGYTKDMFVRRNRLQAGLADIVIPVEWIPKRGTAHTVRYASAAKKRIICLKMPDWSEESHPELTLGRELGGEVFTIPIEGHKFLNSVCTYLSNRRIDNPNELEEQPNTQEEETNTKYDIQNEHKEKASLKDKTSNDTEVKHVHQLSIWDKTE